MSRDQEGMQMHFDNQIFEYQRSKKIKLKLISVKVCLSISKPIFKTLQTFRALKISTRLFLDVELFLRNLKFCRELQNLERFEIFKFNFF